MTAPLFFGYGSLVNAATHAYPGLRAARLDGWSRAWRLAPGRAVSLLTAVPGGTGNDDAGIDGAGIDGAVAEVPGGDWAALDLREAAYRRHAVRCRAADGALMAQVYAVPDPVRTAAPPPILRSYLDTVVGGFLALHGADGAARFFEETEGWDAPIRDDRAAPIYPRHVPATAEVERIVETGLAHVAARPEGRPHPT